MSPKLLQVGVLLDTATPPRWVTEVLERVQQNPGLELAGLQINQSRQASDVNDPPQSSLRQFWRTIGERLMRTIDRPRFTDDPLSTNPLSDEQQALINAGPRASLISNARQFDLLLHLGKHPLDAVTLPASRHGIWSALQSTLPARVERALLQRAPLFTVEHPKLAAACRARFADANIFHHRLHTLCTCLSAGVIRLTLELVCPR